MQVTFLEGAIPLTKTFRSRSDGSIETKPYPMLSRFTSHTEEISTILEFYEAITKHAADGHCLLKGLITRDLQNESRRGTTNTDAYTQWLCLDLDRMEAASTIDILKAMGIDDVTHIIQWSASQGVFPDNEGTLSAHIFILLDEPLPAPTLKSWLMELNFKLFDEQLTLNKANNYIGWPLDITACQNDKLIYIAPPKFVNMSNPHSKTRFELVKRKLNVLSTQRIGTKPIDAMRTEARAKVNQLRQLQGLAPMRAKSVVVGDREIQRKVDACVVTSIDIGPEFTRLNLNGGDSWSYWHPNSNFEQIHDWKTDLWYETKELVPGYYQDKMETQEIDRATPTKDGDLVLGFCDLPTGGYSKGLWNPDTGDLRLYPARSERQLDDWYESHGLTPAHPIPQWTVSFDPRSDVTVDTENMKINLYRRSEYFDIPADAEAKFPTIYNIIKHMLGHDLEVYEHFINWFACIFQRKHKPRTAWVAHGTEGIGKGFFYNKIARPLLNPSNCFMVLANDIEDNFNGWLEGKSFIFVDEVDVDDFREKGRVTAKLRNYITEPVVSIRKMRVQAAEYQNWTSWFFGSNKKQPVHIPAGDRRYNVGRYQAVKLPAPNDDVVLAELPAFAAYLKAHKADIRLADSIIETEDRKHIAQLSMTGAQETAEAILTGDFEALWLARPDENLLVELGSYALAYSSLLKRIKEEGYRKSITRDELFVIFEYTVGKVPQSPNKFSSYLRHQGIKILPLKINKYSIRGISVDWVPLTE